MSLKTAIENDMATFFNTDDFAINVTYNGTAIEAVVTYKGNPDEQGALKARFAEIEIQVSDVASPEYRDKIVIGSDTWRVRKILSGDEYSWLLEIETERRAKM